MVDQGVGGGGQDQVLRGYLEMCSGLREHSTYDVFSTGRTLEGTIMSRLCHGPIWAVVPTLRYLIEHTERKAELARAKEFVSRHMGH